MFTTRVTGAMVCLTSLAVGTMPAGLAWADQVVLGASRDNTLYDDPEGDQSNGAGDHMFCGVSGGGQRRRAVVAFDVASVVPAGSTITAVSLTLHMSRTATGNQTLRLYRLASDWGESTSDAFGNEGAGAPADPGDATWLHTFYPDQFWTDPGGDFIEPPSSQLTVGGIGSYTWESTNMADDVQAWIDDPTTQHGWVLIGNEIGLTTTKRFDTRENPLEDFRPRLVVDFEPPGGVELCMESGEFSNHSSQTGTIADTCVSDDLYFRGRRATFTPAVGRLLTCNTRTTYVGAPPSSIQVAVEMGVTNAAVDNVTGRVQIRNQSTGAYVNVASGVLDAVDTVVAGSPAGNPADFVGSNGEIDVRIIFQQTTGGPNWEGRIDQIIVEVQ